MDYMSYIRAIRSSDLTAPEKITAIMIASHYDFTKKDPAWPSNKTLAQETGLSISSIVRAKRVLSDRGYLSSQRQYNNVTLLIPIVTESITYSQKEQLNTHINTHINTQRNKNVSNETLVSSIIISPVESIEITDISSTINSNTLDTNDIALANVKANPPAAAPDLSQEQADWLMSW